MVLCDNVFCTAVTIESEYVMLAGRRFCCVACAEDWYQQNEVLAEDAMPLGNAAREASKRSASEKTLKDTGWSALLR